MSIDFTRRHFFFGTLLAGAVPAAGFGTSPNLKMLGYKSPNEKLNIASIGAGGKAASDIIGCSSENIVALADPDSKRAERIFKRYETVPKYTDFRKMLDKEDKNIDAVIVLGRRGRAPVAPVAPVTAGLLGGRPLADAGGGDGRPGGRRLVAVA